LQSVFSQWVKRPRELLFDEIWNSRTVHQSCIAINERSLNSPRKGEAHWDKQFPNTIDFQNYQASFQRFSSASIVKLSPISRWTINWRTRKQLQERKLRKELICCSMPALIGVVDSDNSWVLSVIKFGRYLHFRRTRIERDLHHQLLVERRVICFVDNSQSMRVADPVIWWSQCNHPHLLWDIPARTELASRRQESRGWSEIRIDRTMSNTELGTAPWFLLGRTEAPRMFVARGRGFCRPQSRGGLRTLCWIGQPRLFNSNMIRQASVHQQWGGE
jgi:hypothetical protein